MVERFQPEVVNEVIKPQTAAKMRAALEKVVLPGGTATLAAVPGFNVAGKTGTAKNTTRKAAITMASISFPLSA